MTLLDWANKHAQNIGKQFKPEKFNCNYDLSLEINKLSNIHTIYFIIELNKHLKIN